MRDSSGTFGLRSCVGTQHPVTDANPARAAPAVATGRAGRRVAGQVLACGWCGAPVLVAAVGRTPKWCSSSCRHRAWEANRAASLGLVGVRLVDRPISVRAPVVVTQHVEVPNVPKGAGWAAALRALAGQLDTGTVYDRDLPTLIEALHEVHAALARRPGLRRH